MNCKQVRAQFSPRVDNELEPTLARQVEHHLEACPDCAARWASYETTVRMVRTLPQPAPDASFVGQVLDRVRAYEAAGRFEAGRRAEEGLWSRVTRGLGRFDWGGLLFPARLSGALAFGVLAGFLLVWGGILPGFSRAPQSGTLSAQATAPAASVDTSAQAAPQIRPDRPFGDLAAELEQSRTAGKADSSAQRENQQYAQPPGFRPGDFPNGTQQVKLSGSSGRPQITF
jgi:anti-sigma factor RsiW